MDKLTRMVALGAVLALRDAGLETLDRSRVGLVLASGFGSSNTTFGFLESRIRYGDTGVSPLLFSNSGNSGPASNTTVLLGIRGPALTVCQFELPAVAALSIACRWLVEERVDVVLFGGMDEYSSPLGYCRDRFFGDANLGPMEPFALERQTSVVGEGCCFLALGRREAVGTRAMATIEAVTMSPAVPGLPAGDLYLLAADGFSWYGSGYGPVIDSGQPAASYAPYYGSFPAAMAFDFAVAATTYRRGTLLPPPEKGMNVLMEERLRTHPRIRQEEKITCFSCNAHGYQGTVTMGAVEAV